MTLYKYIYQYIISLSVYQQVTPLQIVYPDTALRLQALLDFEEESGEKRVAGDEWLFEGPGSFLPLTVFSFFLSLLKLKPAFRLPFFSICQQFTLKFRKLITHIHTMCSRKK